MTFYSNLKRDYVLNPRGKALYDDTNRFGTKMLEKMGWSKGKGLIANLDGQLDFIKVSHKSDQKGVGFQDRDYQWTSHESNFNSLLKSINSVDNSDEELQDFTVQGFRKDGNVINNGEVSEKEKLLSGISLEEQSKKSRTRVHYKKFTRGKDISRYSEKYLANIFGKKSLDTSVAAEAEVDTETNSNDAITGKETPNFGITTIDTGTTITEYFKNKMKKAGDKSTSGESSEIECVNVVRSSVDADPKIDKKKRKKQKSDSAICDQQNTNLQHENLEILHNDSVSEFSGNVLFPQTQAQETLTEGKHNNDSSEKTKPSKKKKKKGEAVREKTIELLEKESENHIHNELTSPSSESEKDKQIVKTCAENSGKEINSVQEPSPKKLKKTKHGKERDSSMCVTKIEEEDSSIVANDNVYEIRGYRAEIFRYFDLHGFSGSSLSDTTLKICR